MESIAPETLNPFRPPLSAPLIAEQALLPLYVYCETQETRDDLSDYQTERVAEIRHALATLMRYDGQVEELLTTYRDAVAAGLDALAQRVPTLEDVLAHHQPSPLVARLTRFLTTPSLQARRTWPLAQRQELAAFTSYHLDPHAS